MAAPAFRAAGSAQSGSGAVTPGLPAGHTTDDILLLFVQSSNETISAPTGYTEITNSPQGTGTAATAGSVKLACFWKRDNGSESAPSVADSGNHTIAQILAFSGCITSGNPWDVTSGAVDSSAVTTIAMSPVTTTVGSTLIVMAVGHAIDSNSAQGGNQFDSGQSGLDSGTHTNRADSSTNTGTGGGFFIDTGTATVAATVTGYGWLTGSTKTGKLTIALKPPVTGSTAAASGTGTATGVGASTASSTAAAAGVDVTTGTGISTAASTAAAAGVGAAAATGIGAGIGAGNAAGIGTALATAFSTAASPASAAGAGTATATGASTAASTAAAAGVDVTTGIGAATATATGTATGVGAAAATGVAQATAPGTAAGTGTAAATGISTAASPASAAGVGAATATGASTAVATGASAGVDTSAGIGGSIAAAVGSSTGTSTAASTGRSTAASPAAAAGTGAALATGQSTATATGASSGSGSAAATGIAAAFGVASAAGVATVSGFSNAGSTFTAAGTSTASGAGLALALAVGHSAPAFGVAWNISTAAATGKLYDEGAVNLSLAYDFFISPNGLALFVVDFSSKLVYQNTLSTAWDISTAAYAGKSFDVTGEIVTSPSAIFFSPDGLNMYIGDAARDTVYQYALSSAWDVSTAAYSGKVGDLSVQVVTALSSIFIKPDGTALYATDESQGQAYQYSLSTPWDISTVSYAGKSFDATAHIPFNMEQIFFDPDGSRFYIARYGANSTVFQYDASTPWDISTGAYNGVSADVSATTDAGGSDGITGLFFSPDGTKMYVVNFDAGVFYQFGGMSPEAFAVGASMAAATAASAGTGAAAAVGISTATAPGASAGLSTAAAIGRSTALAIGASVGLSDVLATGKAIFSGNGIAAGSGEALATGMIIASGVGLAAGESTADAGGAGTFPAVGVAAGIAVGTAVGRAAVLADGAAAGDSSAEAEGLGLTYDEFLIGYFPPTAILPGTGALNIALKGTLTSQTET